MTDAPSSSPWTNHNVSDPGVTLLQLLAYAVGAISLVAATVAVIKSRRRAD